MDTRHSIAPNQTQPTLVAVRDCCTHRYQAFHRYYAVDVHVMASPQTEPNLFQQEIAPTENLKRRLSNLLLPPPPAALLPSTRPLPLSTNPSLLMLSHKYPYAAHTDVAGSSYTRRGRYSSQHRTTPNIVSKRLLYTQMSGSSQI